MAPTPGQLAYERDLARVPNYHDGAPRPTWDQLQPIARWSWERNPTDRGTRRADGRCSACNASGFTYSGDPDRRGYVCMTCGTIKPEAR